ncbi:hypothetical protein GCM10027284_22290 [Cyclobacterium sediminis]
MRGSLKIDHYLETFKRKLGALAESVALACSGYLKEFYELILLGNPATLLIFWIIAADKT